MGADLSVDGFESKEEDAKTVSVGRNDVIPVHEFVDLEGLECGPTVFDGAFGVRGRLGVGVERCSVK